MESVYSILFEQQDQALGLTFLQDSFQLHDTVEALTHSMQDAALRDGQRRRALEALGRLIRTSKQHCATVLENRIAVPALFKLLESPNLAPLHAKAAALLAAMAGSGRNTASEVAKQVSFSKVNSTLRDVLKDTGAGDARAPLLQLLHSFCQTTWVSKVDIDLVPLLLNCLEEDPDEEVQAVSASVRRCGTLQSLLQ